MERFYLDYNATSPLSPSVNEWLKSGDFLFANPSSQHGRGKSSRKLINEARSYLYSTFSKNEKETSLFFHSGATEAFTTFAYSFSEWTRKEGKKLLICFSPVDHPAVTSLTERNFGSHVEFFKLSLKEDLSYDHLRNLSALTQKKKENPDYIILYHHLWVHNETGLISPLGSLNEFKNIPELYIHIDCVQAPGKVPDWKEIDVGDVCTFSAHKFGALKGIGFSFVTKSLPFFPLITGGGQQQSLRSGTENPMGVMSVMLALKDTVKIDIAATMLLKIELESFIEKELQGIGGLVLAHHPLKNSNTIYFYLDQLSSDIALALFDLQGLELSAGSACSSGAAKTSTILLTLNKKEVASNGLRISLPLSIDSAYLEKLKTAFHNVFNKLRSSSTKA